MFLDTLADHCRNQPDKVAIQFINGPPVTYGELATAVNRTANYLLSLGIAPGDRLAVQLPKCLPFIYLHLAAAQIGAIFLPLNPAYPGAELRYFLADSGARILFADQQKRSEIESTRPALPALETTLFIDPAESWESPRRRILGTAVPAPACRSQSNGDDALYQRHNQPSQRRPNHPRQPDRQYQRPCTKPGAGAPTMCCCMPCRFSTCMDWSSPCTAPCTPAPPPSPSRVSTRRPRSTCCVPGASPSSWACQPCTAAYINWRKEAATISAACAC